MVVLPVEPDPPMLPLLAVVPELDGVVVPEVREPLLVELPGFELPTTEGTVADCAAPVLEAVAVALAEVPDGAGVEDDPGVEDDGWVDDDARVEVEVPWLDPAPPADGGSGGAPKHPAIRKVRRTALDRHPMGFLFSDVPWNEPGAQSGRTGSRNRE